MHILVTGGAGFIGSHVVEAYRAAGHRVSVVDDLSRGRRENLPPEVPLYEIDIRSPELAALFDRIRPEVVNHHAAQVSVSRSVRRPAEDAAINIVGLVNVLQQAARVEARKVLFSSSVAVYGDPQYQPCDEPHPCQPLSPYGLSKLTGERYVRLFGRIHGLDYTLFRYGNVYGPRQDTEGEAGVIALFARAMVDGAPTTIDGDGAQTRDFVYVGDVARASVLALEVGSAETLNLGTGRAVSINALWRTLRDLTGYQGRERHGPPRAGDIRHMVLDVSHAAETLGWRAQVRLDEGLARTVRSMRA